MKPLAGCLSVLFDPYRIFIALLLAVLAWLAPVAWRVEEAAIVAGPGDADARGPCSNVRCGPGFC
jgi:hypothetical protein